MGLPVITLGRFSTAFFRILRYFPPSILMLVPSFKGLMVFEHVSLIDCRHVVEEIDPPVGDGKPNQEYSAKSGAVG